MTTRGQIIRRITPNLIARVIQMMFRTLEINLPRKIAAMVATLPATFRLLRAYSYSTFLPSGNTNFMMGLTKMLVCVLSLVLRTNPSRPLLASSTMARGQVPLWSHWITDHTTSPAMRFRCLTWSYTRYLPQDRCLVQHFQKWFAMCCTWHELCQYASVSSKLQLTLKELPSIMSKWLGIRATGSSTLSPTLVMGRPFMMFFTSKNTVCSTLSDLQR